MFCEAVVPRMRLSIAARPRACAGVDTASLRQALRRRAAHRRRRARRHPPSRHLFDPHGSRPPALYSITYAVPGCRLPRRHGPVREALRGSGKLDVIETAVGAPLEDRDRAPRLHVRPARHRRPSGSGSASGAPATSSPTPATQPEPGAEADPAPRPRPRRAVPRPRVGRRLLRGRSAEQVRGEYAAWAHYVPANRRSRRRSGGLDRIDLARPVPEHPPAGYADPAASPWRGAM